MGWSSLKEYLKKYDSSAVEDSKKKKMKAVAVPSGVLVVDEDPVWQKPVSFEEEEEEDSPQSQRRRRNDSPSPGPAGSERESSDLSPPRQHRQRNDSPSPGPDGFEKESSDLSPSRKRQKLKDFSSSKHQSKSLASSKEVDLSPPRQRRRRYDSPSPERRAKAFNAEQDSDISPPRRRRSHGSVSPMPQKKSSVSGARETDLDDLSPPCRERPRSSKLNDSRVSEDLSPPRNRQKGIDERGHRDNTARERSTEADLSPPRKSKEQHKTGLISGKDFSQENAKIKQDELTRRNEMDPATSGRGAKPVYRFEGEHVSKAEYLKLNRKEEKKPKEEKKLEWSKGLAQKRKAEAMFLEQKLEKGKPYAHSRDDPEHDRMMKDSLRWGDPMANLVKSKQSDWLLSDLGENEKMKESGFIIPQDIPRHSWIKSGLDYEPNRYGIKPGRHWDGVNRSTGYEKQLFKRMNEKRATEREAYLWSVSDM